MATLLIWHGYLLGGTGSNIYAANIAAAWVRAGHHVVLMCQDPHPERFDWVDEIHDVQGAAIVSARCVTPGGVAAKRAAGSGSCLVVRADLGGVLPVYVIDRYAGWQVRHVGEMSGSELDSWGEHYRTAIAGVVEREHPEGALLNHAIPVPALIRDVLDEHRIPYALKVHGSELEYAIAHDVERWRPSARRALLGARRILVGSAHITARTCELIAPPGDADHDAIMARMEEIPPGVDLDLFHPTDDPGATAHELVEALREHAPVSTGRGETAVRALDAVLGATAHPAECARAIAALHGTWEERHVDPGAAAAIDQLQLDHSDAPTVIFVGKFIRQKGVHLLLAALPIVRMQVPNVRLVIAGFGPQREGLEAMITMLDHGDIERFIALASHGHLLDGGDDEPFEHIVEMFTAMDDTELLRYRDAARGIRTCIVFTGLVDHSVLSKLWPLGAVSVVPSILPEAFGMVSAEAAACGCPPVVSDHSGLATVASALHAGLPESLRGIHTFDVHAADAVVQLADRITQLCAMTSEQRSIIADAGRRTVAAEWSWDSIAQRIAQTITSEQVHA